MIPPMTELIPHRAPMLFLDQLIEWEGADALAHKVFKKDSYGVVNGQVTEPVLVEGLAQTMAAKKGMESYVVGEKAGLGMLVGVNDFVVHTLPEAETLVEFSITVTRQIGPFIFVSGKAHHQDSIFADGHLKFFVRDTP